LESADSDRRQAARYQIRTRPEEVNKLKVSASL
jgi:hypothetical protein